MVMIVKDHEKKAHGFISVTWTPCAHVSALLALSGTRIPSPGSRAGHDPGPAEPERVGSACRTGGGRLAATAAAGPQCPDVCPARAGLRAVTPAAGRAVGNENIRATAPLAGPEGAGSRIGCQPGQGGVHRC